MTNYEAMDEPETFVPRHMRDGYKRYIDHGIEPGSFGMAIINGDREGARARADHINIDHIETQIEWVQKYGRRT